VSLVRKKRDR